jgi:transglutaminase-like putative cysteine protease
MAACRNQGGTVRTTCGYRNFLLALLLPFVGPLPAQDTKGPAPSFGMAADLRARHPSVVKYDGFSAWLKENGFSRWHETPRDRDGIVTVVVQALKESRIFAAQVSRPARDGEEAVKRARFVDADGNTRSSALANAREQLAKSRGRQGIRAVRPRVTFLDDGDVRLTWEIEVAVDSTVEILELDQLEKTLRSLGFRKPAAALPPAPKAGGGVAEDLAANELHHPDEFRAEAMEWTRGATTVQEKARRIYEGVKTSYHYDPYVEGIVELTWSDRLVRDQNGRRGICDEFSVVQVSYLRAIGIPARIKLMVWDESGGRNSHAALEYNDGGTWRHMDAIWGFNDPAVYRVKGNVVNVVVMDADEPRDSRSTGSSYGARDPTGDEKLNPFLDFALTPGIAGEKRGGYSY